MSPLASILETVSDAFKLAGVDSLLIGGFAVNYYGHTRATLDIDFMIARNDLDAICEAMREAGFTNIEHFENVVFFQRSAGPVRIDILNVDSATMHELMGRSVEIKGHPYWFRLPALEDLLSMKLFALKNAWDRRVHKDLPDVVNLIHVNQLDMEKTVKPLCLRFADEMICKQIRVEVEALRSL